MLHSPALAYPFHDCLAHFPGRIANAGPNVMQLFDRVRNKKAMRSSLLDRYRIGWTKASSDQILDVNFARLPLPAIHSLEAFRGGRCMSISISCRTGFK